MKLVEYLYVDQRRLNSYFEQISPSPVTYDKVPTWKAGLSMTTLGVEGTQSRFPRPFTTHEKITQLMEYLEKRELCGSDHQEEFQLATFPAYKCFIPPKPELSATFPGLTLWVASAPYDFGLYLLEDFQQDDLPARRRDYTLFSALEMLFNALSSSEKQILQTEAAATLKSVGTDEKRFDWNKIHSWAFSECVEDPLRFLSRIGAHISTPRRIRSLYRTREIVDSSDGTAGIFGYPTFIATAGEDEPDTWQTIMRSRKRWEPLG